MSILRNNILLKNFSNFRIGGPASFFLEVSQVSDLAAGLSEYKKIPESERIFILGKGTNVLFQDKGFDGLVIINKLSGIEKDGDLIKVASGTQISELLDYCIENSLTGLEWAGGLPGTVGGAVRGNAGAFRGETKDSVVRVKSVKLSDYSEVERWRKDLGFSYRDSVYKSGTGRDEFITYVWFGLSGGFKDEIRKKTQEKIDYRWEKHPMEYPNIGSMFKNIPQDILPQNLKEEFSPFVKDDPFPIVPAAKLLALAELKGRTLGGAQVSEKHPNFIVNISNATSSDVLGLMEIEKKEIKDKWGIDLEPEITIL